VYIYTLKEKYNQTDETTSYVPEHVITLREHEPHLFNKFGAVLESDGKDTLWISSGWAFEERGAVWVYNVQQALSRIHPHHSSNHFLMDQFVFSARRPSLNDTASLFAKGREHKVTPLLSVWATSLDLIPLFRLLILGSLW
jgi:hypothetical protein